MPMTAGPEKAVLGTAETEAGVPELETMAVDRLEVEAELETMAADRLEVAAEPAPAAAAMPAIRVKVPATARGSRRTATHPAIRIHGKPSGRA
jgi:hypothetical protein